MIADASAMAMSTYLIEVATPTVAKAVLRGALSGAVSAQAAGPYSTVDTRQARRCFGSAAMPGRRRGRCFSMRRIDAVSCCALD
jgi:hypothetical protein